MRAAGAETHLIHVRELELDDAEVVERVGITEDWWGAGPWLLERGIRFEAAATFFAQDPVTR